MILINVDDILFHPSMFYLSCEVVMDDSLNINVGEEDRNMEDKPDFGTGMRGGRLLGYGMGGSFRGRGMVGGFGFGGGFGQEEEETHCIEFI